MTDDEQGEYEDTITRLTAELEEANNDIDMVMADYQDLGRLMCEDEAVKEITRLREELEDWQESAQRARDESVTDEKHCACVPLLRKSLKEAEALVVELEKDKARLVEIVSRNLPDIHLTFNQSKWFHKLRAALDAAGGE